MTLSRYQFSDFNDPNAPDVHRFDVHDEHGTNAGYAQVENQGRRGSYVDAVHVSEGHRGSGLGNALMERVISKFGAKAMTLHTNPFGTGEGRLNQAQLESMYARHGFEPQGDGYMRRKGQRT